MKALLIDRNTKVVQGLIDVEDVAHLDLIQVGDCIKVLHDDIAMISAEIFVGDDVGGLLDDAAKVPVAAEDEPAYVRILRALGIKG